MYHYGQNFLGATLKGFFLLMNVLPDVFIYLLRQKRCLFFLTDISIYTSGSKANSQKMPTEIKKNSYYCENKDFSGITDIEDI